MNSFLFDLNGTMINDMDYHITAWFEVFNSRGATISWDQMKPACYGKNEEIVERLFPGKFNDAETREMSMEKESRYQRNYKPHMSLLPGLAIFLEKSRECSINMAIGSAAIMANIDFILDNLKLRHYFRVLVSADEVLKSKPDPETFLACAAKLGVAANTCIVFEDSIKGVESAQNAGMKCVALTTLHDEKEFEEFENVLLIIKDYCDPRLEQLFLSYS